MDGKYNGWTNYETWAIKLWIDNEESNYNCWRVIAENIKDAAPMHEHVASGVWSVDEAARFTLADRLKEEHEEQNPLVDSASVYTDLLNSALSRVNWNEIAASLLAE